MIEIIMIVAAAFAGILYGIKVGEEKGYIKGYVQAKAHYINELRQRDISDNERYRQYMRLP